MALFSQAEGRDEYWFVADEVWCDGPATVQKAANSLGSEKLFYSMIGWADHLPGLATPPNGRRLPADPQLTAVLL